MNTDSFVNSNKTVANSEDLYNLKDLFHPSILIIDHELFGNENGKLVGKFKFEIRKNFWIEEFICLRSKAYSFQCEGDYKNKLKGISKMSVKKFFFEEYYNCLFGGKFRRECKPCIMISVNHDMYLQKILETALSAFDGK